jgi:hypothetical protein
LSNRVRIVLFIGGFFFDLRLTTAKTSSLSLIGLTVIAPVFRLKINVYKNLLMYKKMREYEM